MSRFTVTGMSCAACSARVEKAVSAVPGVTECAVSLLTNSMTVEGTASDDAIIAAVNAAGYGAKAAKNGKSVLNADALKDTETPLLKKRFFISLVFLLVLMYFSMGHNMFSFPVGVFLSSSPFALGILQLLLASAVILINKKFFISGTKSVLHGAPNMDTLVALGSGSAFVYSIYSLILLGFGKHGELYFESAAMILVLITVGKILEARSRGKTTNALKSLIALSPKTATLVKDGKEITVPADDVKKDDIFIVKPGDNIPVDGVVAEGFSAVNEASLTGESLPVDKTAGDTVSAATLNMSGFLRCRATRVGENTTLSQIIKTVGEAAATKAPAARAADKVAGVFVPAVIVIAVLTLAVWLLSGIPFDFAFERAISVLVISCPCALGLATPVAVTVGSGVGAKHGVLYKTAASLEETGRVNIVAFDKTGTLTKGEPEVNGIFAAKGCTEEELFSAAFAVEQKSGHPLAKAIVREAQKRNITREDVGGFETLAGSGVCCILKSEKIYGGSAEYIGSITDIDANTRAKADAFAKNGSTPLLFAKGHKLLGLISIADKLKDDSIRAVKELGNMGIQTVMLTGDNINTARAVASQTGIKNVIAGVMPDKKAQAVRKLKQFGKVAMVGDGINDAPALTVADVGIALGAGTDVALDAAEVVIMNNSLGDVAAAIRLSRKTLKNIRENLFWAFFYNAVCIPLAAGCYTGLFGWSMSPVLCAAAMSLSSFFVVSNALRLNLFNMKSSKHDKKPAKKHLAELPASFEEEFAAEPEEMKEEIKMTKILRIDGMMCPHCEAHVKKALEALDGVELAEASHTENKAEITLSKPVADDALKAAVEGAGYTVFGIE